MNTAHLHLICNHAPIFDTIFALVLIALSLFRSQSHSTASPGMKLIGASGVGSRAMLVRIGLWTLVAGAILAVPAFLTGEPAEDVVQRSAGVSERMIDAHESVAKFALMFSILLGVIALGGIWRMRSAILTQPVVVGLLALTIASAGAFSYTAYQGGQIRHTEIAAASSAAPADQPGVNQPGVNQPGVNQPGANQGATHNAGQKDDDD